jgi:arginase
VELVAAQAAGSWTLFAGSVGVIGKADVPVPLVLLPSRPLPGGPLYVHLDLDVIDPSEVPGLRYPAPGGPGAADIAGALRTLLATGRVAAVGIACTWHAGHGAAARIGPFLEGALATEG